MLLYISLCLICTSCYYIVIYIMHYFFKKILVISNIYVLLSFKMNMDYVCLTDCATTHTILCDKRYFLELTSTKANVSIIFDTTNLVEGSEKTNIMPPNGTRFNKDNVLYPSKSRRNLLMFKDIRKNGYHIKTMNKGNVEYLYITSIIFGKKTLNFLLWVESYNYKAY